MFEKTNINQGWKFNKQGETVSDVNIPHTWNLEDGCSGDGLWTGTGIYTKELEIKVDGDKAVFLEFEAVNSIANVFVNDVHVTRHIGGYSAFRVDITDVIFTDKPNKIVVEASNAEVEEVYPLMADFTFYGGMYRDVNLLVVDQVHFNLEDAAGPGVYVSQVDITKEKAIIEVESCVVNDNFESKNVKVEVGILDAEGNIVLGKVQESVVTDSTSFIETFELENPTLWHGVENPYLYTIVSRLSVDGVEVDIREIKTGLRFYEVDPQKGFFLNGESYKLNGVSRHQCHAETGWALGHEQQDRDIELILEVGSNSIRLAHYQHNQYFYDLCDKFGLVLWAEIPFISRSSKTDLTGENAANQLVELIRQNYNHSSIVMWGVENEITIGGKVNRVEEIVQMLHNLAKSEDPYRITTQALVGHHPNKDSMNDITDIMAFNKYYGWYYDEVEDFEGWLNDFNEKNPNLSLGISEYGAEGILMYQNDDPQPKDYSESYHALYHEKVMKIFDAHPEIWGTYVWNMFDFSSDFRDEGGVKGMNNKGLITHDRKTKKDAFFYYKANWSKEPVLHITGKRHVERDCDKILVKVYSNQPELELSVNGTVVATAKTENYTAYFRDVVLVKGDNEIVVKSGNLSDSTVFKFVDELSVDYTYENAGQGMVDNWFDASVELNEEVGEMTYNEGFFSIQDTISAIIENADGEAVLRKYIGPLFEHSMFEMAKGFNLAMLQDFDKKTFTDVIMYNINSDLQKVKK